jgi:DNA-binding GntR family transcriptional regulator
MRVSRHAGDRRTVQAYVRDSIRESIFSGEIRPGERLVQLEVAERLGVSTTPVREALRELATEGLVRVDAHHGAEVRGLDAVELREIYEMRVLLEPEVMRRALPRMGVAEVEAATELQREMSGDVTIPQRAELNRRFHRVFLDACDSRLLANTVTNLQDKYAAYTVASDRRDPSRHARANREHEAILAATRAGDIDGAIVAMLNHIAAPLILTGDIDGQRGTSP